MKRFLVLFVLFALQEESILCMHQDMARPSQDDSCCSHWRPASLETDRAKFYRSSQESADSLCSPLSAETSPRANPADPALATIASIAELESLYHRHRKEKVVVVTDLDNTCVQPQNIWARPEAFAWVRGHYHKTMRGIPEPLRSELALKRAVEFSLRHLRRSPLQYIEARTIDFFNRLQRHGVPVFALTAREATEAEHTAKQLCSIISPRSRREHVSLDFARSRGTRDIEDMGRPIPARVYRGITCGGKNDKGELLCDLLTQLGISPECVLFIDDQLGNCHSVLHALQKRKIRAFCRLYTRLDQATRHFGSHIRTIAKKDLPADLRAEGSVTEWGRNCISPVPGQAAVLSAIIERDRPASR